MLILEMSVVLVLYIISMIITILADRSARENARRIDDKYTTVHYCCIGAGIFLTGMTVLFESIWMCMLLGIPV